MLKARKYSSSTSSPAVLRPKAKAAYLWVRDSVSVMRDSQGRVTGFTGLLSDVTGDLEKLREVQTERSVLRSVQDVIPDGIAAFVRVVRDHTSVRLPAVLEQVPALRHDEERLHDLASKRCIGEQRLQPWSVADHPDLRDFGYRL